MTLPENAAGGLRAQAFTGAYGSKESEASANVEGANVTFETTHQLPMRGGMTIDIYIPQGILKPPSALTKLGWFLGSNPIVFFPLFTLAVMFGLWYSVGRDTRSRRLGGPAVRTAQRRLPRQSRDFLDDTPAPAT